MSEISIFLLVSVADQVGLNLTLAETPKTSFLTLWPIWGWCHGLESHPAETHGYRVSGLSTTPQWQELLFFQFNKLF